MRPNVVKKTYNLPASLIARAQRILETRTETETIVRALGEIAFLDEVERAVRRSAARLPRFRPVR